MNKLSLSITKSAVMEMILHIRPCTESSNQLIYLRLSAFICGQLLLSGLYSHRGTFDN
ncbi:MULTISPECIES: hypothetical protein [Aphanizomenonaceae]|jgi:hypothetical protein|uniref:Transposase n=1 Tax=Dolichospermum heterosporum TAC447 TaxID=747523 RepID=A0ABY5LZW8_9CYAN|nr:MULTISPECIES: hypothetical protein [Aphanizomenonaceae]MDK2410416.1 hypothetical protein [Aphanizomenon sp. 202]MDK2461193.1 hypothetical protein [Aphanizomenon sp. PH219]UUO16534.1 hypothetical protein NG743_05730 [Dolichospermum heterosporum TAC447]